MFEIFSIYFVVPRSFMLHFKIFLSGIHPRVVAFDQYCRVLETKCSDPEVCETDYRFLT